MIIQVIWSGPPVLLLYGPAEVGAPASAVMSEALTGPNRNY